MVYKTIGEIVIEVDNLGLYTRTSEGLFRGTEAEILQHLRATEVLYYHTGTRNLQQAKRHHIQSSMLQWSTKLLGTEGEEKFKKLRLQNEEILQKIEKLEEEILLLAHQSTEVYFKMFNTIQEYLIPNEDADTV